MSDEKDKEMQAQPNARTSSYGGGLPCIGDSDWARSYYLGTEFAAGINANGDHLAPGSSAELRSAIYNSGEASQFRHTLARSYPSSYISWAPNAPKICVLGNCQGPNIAKALTAVSRAPLSTCGLEIMAFNSNKDAFFKAIDSADYVVACKTYSADFEEISIDALRLRRPNCVLEYSPIYFEGLHPDIIYLGSRGNRVYSPIGDYNSRITLAGYLAGHGVKDTIDFFNEQTYADSSFFDVFAKSEQEFRRRESVLGPDSVLFSDLFFSKIRDVPLLYSVNHPTSELLIDIAKIILDRLGFRSVNVSPSLFSNTLSDNVIWPIPEEFTVHHGLRYRTNAAFSLNQSAINLEEFIWRSHQIYGAVSRDLLTACAREGNLNIKLT
jgi:hypothetical protein